jgi:RNA polymerase sigma-70 factor (ECF subfamily)
MSCCGIKGELCQLDDNALAAQLAAGLDDALNVLMERHGATVWRIARRIVRHDAEADDTAQQVFLEVFRDIATFDPARGAFAAWVKELARSRALDQRKYLYRREFYSAVTLDEEAATQRPTGQTLETARWTQEILATLEPKERRFVVLKYIEGHTAKEIAEITGEGVSTVRHSLAASRRKLALAVFGNSLPLTG